MLLLGVASGIRHDSIWDDAMGGVDSSDYNQSTPKEYKPAEKPKPKKITMKLCTKNKEHKKKNKNKCLYRKKKQKIRKLKWIMNYTNLQKLLSQVIYILLFNLEKKWKN